MIEKKLVFCAKNNFNVLLVGDAGVGKTALIKEAFESCNLKWKYFSAATMDPWVDFIGVPKEVEDVNGDKYLDLIRMKGLDRVEALFFDELNRSHKKIRNAVMELIQFKSINGHKFPNLKIVWAAINPEDEEETYDVEKLDPAQKDRFHVVFEIPYKVNVNYFRNKFGNNGIIAAEWWEKIPLKNKRNILSPRRLDYALEYYTKMGDIRDIIPNSFNVNELLLKLSNDIIEEDLDEIFRTKNVEKAREVMEDFSTQKIIIENLNSDLKKAFFLQFADFEIISSLMEKNNYFQIVLNNSLNNEKFTNIVKNIYETTKDELLKNKILIFAKTHIEWGEENFKILKNKSVLNKNLNIPKKLNKTVFINIVKDLCSEKRSFRENAFKNIWKAVGEDINRNDIIELFKAIDFFILNSSVNSLVDLKEEMSILDFLMNSSILIWNKKTTLDSFLSLNSVRILKENNIYSNFLN